MRVTHVSRDEILEAIRKDGYGALEDVDSVILEIDGHFSVIGRKENSTHTAIANVLDNPPSP